MPPIELTERLALLLALAIFLGLAFEAICKRDQPTILGGIRTFPLVGLAGAMLYLIEPQRAFAFIAGLFAMGAWLYAFLRPERPPDTGSGERRRDHRLDRVAQMRLAEPSRRRYRIARLR